MESKDSFYNNLVYCLVQLKEYSLEQPLSFKLGFVCGVEQSFDYIMIYPILNSGKLSTLISYKKQDFIKTFKVIPIEKLSGHQKIIFNSFKNIAAHKEYHTKIETKELNNKLGFILDEFTIDE